MTSCSASRPRSWRGATSSAPARARRGQDAVRRDRRSDPRRPDLRLLRRGSGGIPGEKFASTRPNVDIEVTREPIGVVGIIAPWNFPIAIPAWKIAPALAYGNAVVFKPADLVPGPAHALAEIIVRAGVPKGVFNLVVGRGSVVGQAILDHKRVDAVTFTGSVATGRRVAAACAGAMRRFQLEMGGKNPLVVLADADLPTAVECAVNGPISRPASAARRRRGSSSRRRSTGLSPTS